MITLAVRGWQLEVARWRCLLPHHAWLDRPGYCWLWFCAYPTGPEQT